MALIGVLGASIFGGIWNQFGTIFIILGTFGGTLGAIEGAFGGTWWSIWMHLDALGGTLGLWGSLEAISEGTLVAI